MPASKALRRFVGLGFVMLVALGTVAFLAYANVASQRHRAEKLVEVLSNVVPGKTPQDVVRAELQRESFVPGRSKACPNDASHGCDQFEFSNRWLSTLHLAPAKYVWITLDYRNGVVVSKSIQFAEDPRISAVTRQLLRADEPSLSDSSISNRQVLVNMVSKENAIVKLYDNENVPLEQLRKDWSVNLSCLSKLQACSDPRSILAGIS